MYGAVAAQDESRTSLRCLGELERGESLEYRGHQNIHFQSRQRSADAEVDSGAEPDVWVSSTFEVHLGGAVENRLVTVR